MPKARCAPSGWLRYLATAGDHAGDVTDGQHAPNDADYVLSSEPICKRARCTQNIYYVPVNFSGGSSSIQASAGYLGLSVRLLAETRRVASALGLPEDFDPDSDEVDGACNADARDAEGWQRYGIESYACLRLIHAARHSVNIGAAITYC